MVIKGRSRAWLRRGLCAELVMSKHKSKRKRKKKTFRHIRQGKHLLTLMKRSRYGVGRPWWTTWRTATTHAGRTGAQSCSHMPTASFLLIKMLTTTKTPGCKSSGDFNNSIKVIDGWSGGFMSWSSARRASMSPNRARTERADRDMDLDDAERH